MSIFEKSQWIWLSSGQSPDTYAEFRFFLKRTDAPTTLFLSCDSDYTLYANGRFVTSGQYGDYEHYKSYDTVSLDGYLDGDETCIDILVHYVGHPTSRYRVGAAGLLYEVRAGERTVAYSGEHTLSRLSPTYAQGMCRLVSPQLGFTFAYDATRETEAGFAPSVTVNKTCTMIPRPIPKARILDRAPIASVKKRSETDLLIDLGGETVGLATLDFVSACEQTVTVAWGEHIADGGVRREIGARHFDFAYRAHAGHNTFTNFMLRLGCRYLEVFSEHPIEPRYIGLLPQVTEVTRRAYTAKAPLDGRIYEACVRTLELCMMEHYVDCPWREQALYAFDSRNQMLCGYAAFEGGNAAYARANLKLIGMDRREDGLLSICYPCGTPLAIPSFSLYYILAMWEYVLHTNDLTLAKELTDKMESILAVFTDRLCDGLIPCFDSENTWNFYDWSAFAEGALRKKEEATADLFLNCLFIMALTAYRHICEHIGHPYPYGTRDEEVKAAVRREFLTPCGLYTVHAGQEEYTVLGQALAVLSGVAEGDGARRLCDAIVAETLPDASLSMKIHMYDALLMTDTAAYRDFVLEDIRRCYGRMLKAGSDTVWETLDGEAAFDGAGSLCHGWSAVPVVIYHRLGIIRYTDETAEVLSIKKKGDPTPCGKTRKKP